MISTVCLKNITKVFRGGVIANRNVSLKAERGEIHVILGENGAGKTTAMRILAGLCQPTGGSVEIDGKEVILRNPLQARRLGVATVQQHFSLVPALTVAENLELSNLECPFLLQSALWERKLVETSRLLGFEIRPSAVVRDLSMGERQRVEVFRLVLEGASVLILDEPTSILAPTEADVLFGHLKKFAREGHIILLVTHKISHVQAVGDRVTVLRAGQVIASGGVNEFSERLLSELMVGRPSRTHSGKSRQCVVSEHALLCVANLSMRPTRSLCGITNASFTLRSGEILGVAGISGNGQDELISAIVGEAKPHIGKVVYEAVPSSANPAALNATDQVRIQRNRMCAYVPADRIGMGTAPSLTVRDNLCLRVFSSQFFNLGPFLRHGRLLRFARDKISMYAIRPDAAATYARNLSGGNLQKVILARELHNAPPVLVAVNPTAGLDVGAVEEVHNRLVEFVDYKDRPAAVLLISEDLDELIELCNRILVIYEGRILGEVVICEQAKHDLTIELGMLMSGVVSKLQGSHDSWSVQ